MFRQSWARQYTARTVGLIPSGIRTYWESAPLGLFGIKACNSSSWWAHITKPDSSAFVKEPVLHAQKKKCLFLCHASLGEQQSQTAKKFAVHQRFFNRQEHVVSFVSAHIMERGSTHRWQVHAYDRTGRNNYGVFFSWAMEKKVVAWRNDSQHSSWIVWRNWITIPWEGVAKERYLLRCFEHLTL